MLNANELRPTLPPPARERASVLAFEALVRAEGEERARLRNVARAFKVASPGHADLGRALSSPPWA